MENTLTCNNLKCRKELTDRALVTTCSHIFCIECVQRLGLVGQDSQRRNTCPVCNAQLAKAEDISINNLNPTEEFKTCVLSGLSPNFVMECAGRAISFWAYQTTQNLHYQQYLYKTLSEKYSALWARCDQINRDSDAKVNSLCEKLESMTASRDILQRKNDELAEAFKDKSRKLFQTQELYTKVKRKAELGRIERAASDAVDSSLRSVPPPVMNNQEAHPFLPPQFHDPNERSYPSGHGLRFDATAFVPGLSGLNTQQHAPEGQWPRKRTPSHGLTPEAQPYRQPPNDRGRADVFHPTMSGSTGLARGDGLRASGLNSPSFPPRRDAWVGVGLSSGLKVGQPTGQTGLNGPLRNL
ncbi:hypothetical protein V8C44DRAFT_326332 [Trichoderma aethiopicum]